MAEIASEKKKKGNVLSSFVVITIVLSVLAVSVSTISAQTPVPPEITNIIVTADPAGIPADDESVSDITASTEWSGIVISGWQIQFEIISQPGGATLTDSWVQIDSEGKAYTQLIAGTNDGEVVIKAHARGDTWYKENFTTVTLLPPPTLTPWNNITKDALTEVTIIESECVYFNATADQPIDTWRWFVDGVNQTHDFDEFTHCWAVGGTYYVAVNATNANGTSDTITWTVTVEDVTAPASITNLVSTTGNFWIKWSWTNPPDADFSHVMVYIDDIPVTNISEPQNWYNGTYEPHATKTISTHTVDTSGNINEAGVYQTTTIPNNVPVMEAIAPEFPAIGETVTIDANANDLDYTDTLTYSCDRTDLFTDFNPATGIGSWTPWVAGTYYVDFGVSDGYIGGTDNETVMIVVSGTGVDLKVEGAEYAEKSVAPGETATYLLTVKNVGSVPDTYTLTVEKPAGLDVGELSTYTITNLAPGNTADVLLNVSDATEDEYVVNVTATGTYPGVSAKVTTKTIVSLDLPDLIVTEITLNCDYLFANESNNINATIKNNGTAAAGAFNVSFVIDGFSEEVEVSGLAIGASEEVTVTDPTLRNAGDSVTITVIADCDGAIAETNETNNVTVQVETVVNNGYKSKSFAGLPSLVLLEHDKFNGSIVYTVGNSSKVELYPADTTTTGFDITVPGGATVRTARLYVYWYDSWYSTVHGDADLEVTFDGHSFTTPGASYTDGKGFGSYNYPKGTYAYDVTSAVSGTGTYTATIENRAPNTNTVLTGQLLLVVYEDTTEPEMEYWITEGCDLLKADSNYCVSPAEAIANVTFEGTIDVANKSARLITVVAQGNEPGTDLSFNEQVWEDVWQTPEGSSKIDIDDRSVTGLRTSGNVVDFRDTGTMGMQASNAILMVKTTITEEYNITIYTGWNLISIPVMPADTSLTATISGAVNEDTIYKWVPGEGYKSAYYYDGLWYGEVSEVEPIEPEVGYWFERRDAEYNLTIVGEPLTGTIETPIYTGWNLVGYASLTERDLSVINNPVNEDTIYRWIPGEGYKSAYYYDGLWYGEVSEVEPIEAGVGYWFERKGPPYDWTYPA